MRVSVSERPWKSFYISGQITKRRTYMAGTKAGGKLAAAKNLARDPNFYAKIGAKGGKNGRTGGFAANPELARIAGAKGGRISRRRKITAEK
jgi:general stress protein YciG